MWCTNCNKIAHGKFCSDCKGVLQEDIPIEVYWCSNCNTPLIRTLNNISKDSCPLCGNKIEYLSKDIRPVFPEERLLIEIVLGEPFKYINCSVWSNASRYYINGERLNISSRNFEKADKEYLRRKLLELSDKNSYEYFEKQIEKFKIANSDRLSKITDEAYSFINNSRDGYLDEQVVISFSGGKDSTVTAELVIKAIGNASLVHIFGDTTLEFPITHKYKERYREANNNAIIRVAQNKDNDFYNVCDELGPPSRVMRWCCTMFKTGPISRVINSVFTNESVLTFYGIRKNESVSRSKYDRIYDSPKILKQRVASPIFFWSDADIWLYLLSNEVDFNDAYRLGYDRVGCWCCPNNSGKSQFLAEIYMPDESSKWREYLINFAKKIGKPDAEIYIDTGKWKARQGGAGLKAADDVKIQYSNCTTEEDARIYRLNKPITDDFYNLFIPFGTVSKELGRKIIEEVIILKNNIPIISIHPFKSDEYDLAVKIKVHSVENKGELHRMISYQIRKYNACRKCLGCETVCEHGAITVTSNGYTINSYKCVKCLKCVKQEFLEGGCLMKRYLATTNKIV